MWPHYDAVSKRCAKMYDDFKQGQDITKYTTNGTEDKKYDTMKKTKRFDSPTRSPD